MKVAYLVSWFPAITETFILDEVRELRSRGVEVDVLPLFGRRGGDVHAGWRGLKGCTHYHRSLSREGLGDRVELRGALPHQEIPAVLRASTAMVLPSVTSRDGQMEGIPVALMEAMASGVPVIATRLSGIPELVRNGETGLLVPERDPAALAAAMERLAADPALGVRLAGAARSVVRERFDRRRNVARLAALFDPFIADAEPTPFRCGKAMRGRAAGRARKG